MLVEKKKVYTKIQLSNTFIQLELFYLLQTINVGPQRLLKVWFQIPKTMLYVSHRKGYNVDFHIRSENSIKDRIFAEAFYLVEG